jgi:O-antigen/teichoic acid export membrane protein
MFAAAAAFVKTFVYAGILAPVDFGIFTLATLIATFGGYFATAGILDGLACKIPIIIGQGLDHKKIRSAALTMIVVISACVSVLLAVFCLIIINKNEIYSSLLWMVPFFITTVVVSALQVDMQTRELSIPYSFILLLKNVMGPVIVVLIPAVRCVEGVLIIETVTLILCGIICLIVWCHDLRLIFSNFEEVKSLILIGIPFTINSLTQNIASNLDRWAVQVAFGVGALGTYAFALNFATMGSVILNMVQLYAGPRMLRTYALTNDLKTLLTRLKYLVTGVLVLFSVGYTPLIMLLPTFISNFFPRYVDSIELVYAVSIGSLVITTNFYDIVFRATGNGRPLVAIQLFVVIISLCAYGCLYLLGSPILGYALIFSVGRIIASCLGWGWAFKCVQK